MKKAFVFDMPDAVRFTEARQRLLRQILPDLKRQLVLETALDVGCGVGYFSQLLTDIGLRVVGCDGRRENVEEAQRRLPEIKFDVVNVEDLAMRQLGSFDLVLCVGLLYHLENPFAAVRNFAALTTKVLLIESVVIPGHQPISWLRDEDHSEDQGANFVAFYPTESCIIRMCYSAGFTFMYRFNQLPAHEDFRSTLSRKRTRTMLVASKVRLDYPVLELVPEPLRMVNPWATQWVKLGYPFYRLWHFSKKPLPGRMQSVRLRLKRLWTS